MFNIWQSLSSLTIVHSSLFIKRFFIMKLSSFFSLSIILCVMLPAVAKKPNVNQTREEKVRADQKKVKAEGYWIYNDIKKGFAEARQTGKPILVVLRCIPCEECVKLDEDLMEKDEHLKGLLDQFVRVRQISTNGLDLSLFQYDYDQSFAVFLMNADKTIYGRFGTRSHRTLWSEDVSIKGLAKAMQGALDMHADFPKHKKSLVAKRGPKPLVSSPEKFPSLAKKFKSTLNQKGNITKSCIHCHQIGDAQRQFYVNRGKKIPDKILFQYPHPKILGLILDPAEKATVKKVTSHSVAQKAGFQAGDKIIKLENQPLLSLADIQWVLHHADDTDNLTAEVKRDGAAIRLTIPLKSGWRQEDNINWRASTWPLRGTMAGGMSLELASAQQRKRAGINTPSQMALRIKRLGQYGKHGAAKRAGFRVGDIIVSYGGKTNLRRETDLLTHTVNAHRPGEKIPVTVFRNGKNIKLRMPIQR